MGLFTDIENFLFEVMKIRPLPVPYIKHYSSVIYIQSNALIEFQLTKFLES